MRALITVVLLVQVLTQDEMNYKLFEVVDQNNDNVVTRKEFKSFVDEYYY